MQGHTRGESSFDFMENHVSIDDALKVLAADPVFVALNNDLMRKEEELQQVRADWNAYVLKGLKAQNEQAALEHENQRSNGG